MTDERIFAAWDSLNIDPRGILSDRLKLDFAHALLSASKPAVTVPTGWRIRIFDDGAAVVEKDGLGGVVCKSSDESIASAILRELVGDILAASPAAGSE
jgi:hypothetical protein